MKDNEHKSGWISVKDKPFNLELNHPYLVYGRQLHSHWPGKAIAAWDGKVWYEYADDTYIYRDEEIDCFMDVLSLIPDPKAGDCDR